MGGFTDNTKVVPLTDNQKQQWTDAIAHMDDHFLPALAWQGEGAAHKHVFVASFDGTWNDRENLKPGEAPTNPAALEKELSKLYDGKMLDGAYYNGVGTRANPLSRVIDGMSGNGSEARAEQAFSDFQHKAQEWLKEDPSAQIHVFAMGFSRGAASARHFLNLVDERGVPSDEGRRYVLDDPYTESPLNDKSVQVYDSFLRKPGSVSSSALLYDTVATGQENVLNLGIPASTHFVAHFTSQDENRPTFPLTDIGGHSLEKADSSRFLTISLPGVHSDIGGGYTEGVAKLGHYLGEQALYRLGFDVELGPVPKEALNEGMHQHGSSPAPNNFSQAADDRALSRNTHHVANAELTPAEQIAIYEENRDASSAAALRYLVELRNGSAPQDPWGLENHGIALTPHVDGSMDVYVSNPKALTFDETTGTISVHGTVVKKLNEDDYAKLEAGERIVEVFSVAPYFAADLVTAPALASESTGMGQPILAQKEQAQREAPVLADSASFTR